MPSRSIASVGLMAGLALTWFASPASGFRGGAPSGFTGSPGDGAYSCNFCHTEPPGSGLVQIIGVPGAYQPGRLYTLTVRVSDPEKFGAGFQITAENAVDEKVGGFEIIDPNTLYADNLIPWVTHSPEGVDNSVQHWSSMGGAFEFKVGWRPSAGSTAGPITFYAAGNAINNDQFHTGDRIYFTSETTEYGGCLWDLNGDGRIDSIDLATLLQSWGDPYGAAELGEMLGSWGPCP